MAIPAEQLNKLLKLSAEARSDVAEALLVSLESEDCDPDAASAWAAEIERRVKSNARGIPAEQVFAELRARFHGE